MYKDTQYFILYHIDVQRHAIFHTVSHRCTLLACDGAYCSWKLWLWYKIIIKMILTLNNTITFSSLSSNIIFVFPPGSADYPCQTSPCENGGTCIVVGAGSDFDYFCRCDQTGHVGRRCENGEWSDWLNVFKMDFSWCFFKLKFQPFQHIGLRNFVKVNIFEFSKCIKENNKKTTAYIHSKTMGNPFLP